MAVTKKGYYKSTRLYALNATISLKAIIILDKGLDDDLGLIFATHKTLIGFILSFFLNHYISITEITVEV